LIISLSETIIRNTISYSSTKYVTPTIDNLMANSKKIAKFRINIEHDSSHDTSAVTGAMGGPGPSGEAVTMHLYYEYNTLADSVSHNVRADGVVNLKAGAEKKSSEVTRVITSTSIIPVNVARVIGKWLIEQADQAESRRSQLDDLNKKMEEETS